MRQAHLSKARLQALHDGEPGRGGELAHLASCPVCQQSFDDTRWTMLLMRLRAGKLSPDPHPDRDELLAFQVKSLGTAREASIREHLVRCRLCMSAYARIRAGRQRTQYSSPAPEVMQAAMQQFRPRKIRRLGRLLIERVGEGLAVNLLPSLEAGGYPRRLGLVAEMGLELESQAGGHPASASRRAKRMRGAADERWLHFLELDECAASEAAPADSCATIEGPSWSLHVEAVPDAPEELLRITLTPADQSRSAAEIPIRICSPDGDEQVSATDADGVALLPCTPGDSRLVVEVDPPLSLEIEFEN